MTNEQIVDAVLEAIELANELDVDYAVDDVGEFYEDLYAAVHGEEE